MNLRRFAEQLRADFLQPPAATFVQRKARLRRDFHAAVEREGFLTRERLCDAHRHRLPPQQAEETGLKWPLPTSQRINRVN